jgi:hypothetical protein
MSNNDGLVSRVIAKLHQHKAKEFGKLKYAPNFNKATRFILVWDSSCSPSETKAIKEYIEYLKNAGKQVIRIVYFNVKTTEETPLVPEVNTYHVGKWDFDRTGFPKAEDLKNVLLQETDFFISLDLNGNWQFLGMASVCKAACKVGPYNAKHLGNYDVLIKPTDKNSMNQYLCDLKEHLNKLA